MVWPFNTKGDKQSGTDPRNFSNSTKVIGARGEKLAAKFLRKRGCKLLATNYRCPVGEGDIIILDKSAGELAVVEVKTRSEGQRTLPESAVNAEKQKRLRKIAKYYLDTHETGELGMRIDVVSITIPTAPGAKPEIRHIPNAF
ncbi:MAG: YraN family protein [Phycisphaerae bacterium]|nr:YraN family protein [Phycisphaerae bacterium]